VQTCSGAAGDDRAFWRSAGGLRASGDEHVTGSG
jgi:hypothetical protein